MNVLKKEAEYYGISPLINRLSLCAELDNPSCGGVLFHGFIPPPELPPIDAENSDHSKTKHHHTYGGSTQSSKRDLVALKSQMLIFILFGIRHEYAVVVSHALDSSVHSLELSASNNHEEISLVCSLILQIY